MPTLAAFFVAACLLLGVALSVWDWYHCLRRKDRQVSKLAPMYLAISATVVIMMHVNADPKASLVAMGLWWYLAGVIASIVGDAFLLKDTGFVAGLAAFLAAHICLAIAFWHHAELVEPRAISIVGTLMVGAAIAAVPGATFVRQVPGREFVAVLTYLLAISFMLVTAINTARPLFIAGAVLFAVSDYLLARQRYIEHSSVSSIHVMTTYHMAQWCFLLAMALAAGVFTLSLS